jgi:NADH-quinone oxidoreductase subunit G
LRGLPFLLAAGVLANPTTNFAHVVLPTAAWAEKRGSMINVTGRLQRLGLAVHPPGQARDDWEVLRDLADAVTGERGPALLEDVFAAMGRDFDKFARLSLGKIGDLGVQLYDTGVRIPLLERERERRAQGLITG